MRGQILVTCSHVQQIKKSDALCQLINWRNNQMEGVNLLKSLSPDNAELRRILGPVYNRVAGALAGGQPLQSTTAPQPTVAPAVGTGPSAVPAVRAAPQASSSSTQSKGPATKKRKIAYDPKSVIDLT